MMTNLYYVTPKGYSMGYYVVADTIQEAVERVFDSLGQEEPNPNMSNVKYIEQILLPDRAKIISNNA